MDSYNTLYYYHRLKYKTSERYNYKRVNNRCSLEEVQRKSELHIRSALEHTKGGGAYWHLART